MNLVTKAVRDAQWAIPREILRVAYLDSSISHALSRYHQSPISLDEAIKDTTIVPRVIVDCNVVGGQTVVIDVRGLVPMEVDNHNYIYQIPADRVGNRTILSVLSGSYYQSGLLSANAYGSVPAMIPRAGSELTSTNAKAFDSRGNLPVLSTSDCKVVGHNVIMVRNQLRTPGIVQFRCIVEHEESLGDISILASPQFSKLCTFAVKSFIYNELVIGLDRGRIERGHEIGAFKSIVDGYSDAEENYWTYLTEEWAGVAIHSDRLTYNDLLAIQINPGI